MSKLKIFFKTPKGRRLILGLLGIASVISVIFNPIITQPIDGIDNDRRIAFEVFLIIPLTILLLLVGFVFWIAKGFEKLDISIKKSIAVPLNVYDRSFLGFCLWGGFFGFAISTFIGVNNLDLFLNSAFIIPDELKEDIQNSVLYSLKNPGSAYIISIMILPLLGYALFFIYKIIYFGTIMKFEKNDDVSLNQQEYKTIGKFSVFVLLISFFGLFTYVHTIMSGGLEKLDDWNKILLVFLPIYSPAMSLFMVISIGVSRFFYYMVGFRSNSD